MLRANFLPDPVTEQLRTYSRHRLNLIQQEADSVRKMQKYLRLLNVRLDVVLKDITGHTGTAIIEAICKGETNPQILAAFRNGNCKKSEEEIAKALQSNKRPDYLFCLQQELALYKIYRTQIENCDASIKNMLEQNINSDEVKKNLALQQNHIKK